MCILQQLSWASLQPVRLMPVQTPIYRSGVCCQLQEIMSKAQGPAVSLKKGSHQGQGRKGTRSVVLGEKPVFCANTNSWIRVLLWLIPLHIMVGFGALPARRCDASSATMRMAPKPPGPRAGRRDAGWRMRKAGCGMEDAGCGMEDAGCGASRRSRRGCLLPLGGRRTVTAGHRAGPPRRDDPWPCCSAFSPAGPESGRAGPKKAQVSQKRSVCERLTSFTDPSPPVAVSRDGLSLTWGWDADRVTLFPSFRVWDGADCITQNPLRSCVLGSPRLLGLM